jgi:hypothetical protein
MEGVAVAMGVTGSVESGVRAAMAMEARLRMAAKQRHSGNRRHR